MSRDLFKRAAARLESRLASQTDVDIVYSRELALGGNPPPVGVGNITVSEPDADGNVIVSIATTGSVGRTPFASQSQGGLTLTDEHRDYLVEMANLAPFWAIAGGKPEPQAGDEVREVLNGLPSETAVFGAMSPGNVPVFTRPG